MKKVLKRKILINRTSTGIYGEIGEKTGVTITTGFNSTQEVCVGDLVAFEVEGSERDLRSGIVCKSDGRYAVMNSFARGILEGRHGVKNLHIVLNHKHITNEVLKELHDGYLVIKEEYATEMTLEQIENALGYSIKIVEG